MLNSYGEPIGHVIVGIHVGQVTYRSKFGQNVMLQEGDLIYRLELDRYVTRQSSAT